MIAEFRGFYRKLPPWLRQTVRVVPFNYRLGSNYRQTLRFLKESERWSKEQHREYQRQQLANLLEGAISHVPYYQRYRHLLGRNAFEILSEIEPVTKQQIQENPETFLMPKGLRGKWHLTYTGGSAGRPLTICLDNDAAEREWAFMTAQWSRVGYRPGDRRISFRTTELITEPNHPIVANPVFNEMLCSPVNLTEERLAAYFELMRSFRPKFIRGYPSVLTVLARFSSDNLIGDFPPLKAVLCASEEVSAPQRAFLEKAFRARVYSWYGMSEKVVLAGECESSANYHCFPQYGITEVIDSHGKISSQPGNEGEIIGTGFLNRIMPFIRYRLDDRASIIADQCPACGRRHILLSAVRGHHTQGSLIGRSGVEISMTAVNVHDDSFKGVRQYQFHQRKPGEVTVYLRVTSGFDQERRQLIMKSLTQRTGSELEYSVQIVDHIEQTTLGKGIYLRQDIPVATRQEPANSEVRQAKEHQDEQTQLDR